MQRQIETLAVERRRPRRTVGRMLLFDFDVSVVQSRYDNHQIRIDLYSESARGCRRRSIFDASGKFEITTSISILLTKPPYSWVDMSRPHMVEALPKLLEMDAFTTLGQPSRRLPPYGQVLQRIKCDVRNDAILRLN